MCNKTNKCTFVTEDLVENDKIGKKNLVGELRWRLYDDICMREMS